ncbi:MAG: peptidylprolyl isomerase [Bacteroidota bacterium]
MKRVFYLALFAFGLMLAACGSDGHTYAEITTDFGTMKVKLYNDTPLHRDNFIKLANEGFYEGLLFHRVINGFMVQGGDPDSKNAPPEMQLGGGGPGYQIPAEIGRPHIKGALAAARTQNPEKKSSGCQFYIVHGKTVPQSQLAGLEKQKKIKYNPEQVKLYSKIGGAPFLDMEYTVFGELVEGFEVLDKIATVPTKPGDRPVEDVKMDVKILN